MTDREKAIIYFKDMRKRFCEDYLNICPKHSTAYKATLAEKDFYDTAIEALQQEPCGDCISREAVMHILDEVGGDFDSPREAVVPIDYIADMVSELPSVTAQPCDDVISRQAVISTIYDNKSDFKNDFAQGFFVDKIKGFPPVTIQPNKWIPITSRPMTEEEKEDFAERTGYDEKDFDDILSCPLPEDGETVLITDRLGNVEVDTFINDCDGCYFECNCDMEDVKAWMQLPPPYQSEIPTGAEGSEKND